ncbi:MAG: M15 family metallopeptidase [Actinomycetota bacterium]|nr:M15 family metallopeptidase [Actinomycetota bacterium]
MRPGPLGRDSRPLLRRRRRLARFSNQEYANCRRRPPSRTSSAYARGDKQNSESLRPKGVRAFSSIGWGWGGSWPGLTKDHMHFSSSGH